MTSKDSGKATNKMPSLNEKGCGTRNEIKRDAIDGHCSSERVGLRFAFGEEVEVADGEDDVGGVAEQDGVTGDFGGAAGDGGVGVFDGDLCGAGGGDSELLEGDVGVVRTAPGIIEGEVACGDYVPGDLWIFGYGVFPLERVCGVDDLGADQGFGFRFAPARDGFCGECAEDSPTADELVGNCAGCVGGSHGGRRELRAGSDGTLRW